jgi:hypothetical protein
MAQGLLGHCAQGHFQIILNPRYSPLLQWRLRLFDRLMYCSGCWSYTVGAITTPVFIAIPFLTIWIGVHAASGSVPDSAWHVPAATSWQVIHELFGQPRRVHCMHPQHPSRNCLKI